MSEGPNYVDVEEYIDKLNDLIPNLTDIVGTLVDQNAALVFAVAFLSRRLSESGVIDGATLSDQAIDHMTEVMGESEVRTTLLRNILSGETPALPKIPKLSVIRGGRDDPPPDGAE